MRKLFSAAMMLLLVSFAFSSCMDNDGNEAEATCYYRGYLYNFTFTDSADSSYQSLLEESFDRMGLTGTSSVFSESAKIAESDMYRVFFMCDQQALTTYRRKVESLTLDGVRSNIFNAHADSLVALGYSSGRDLPLDNFTVRFLLVGGRLFVEPLDTLPVYVAE